MSVDAWAAKEAGGKLEPFKFDFDGDLGEQEVEIDVESCGLCHSDISMINNDWGMSSYPLVPGHEVIGKIASIGSKVVNHKVGDRVGLGWFKNFCGACTHCLAGNSGACANVQPTIVGSHGGFAKKVRAGATATVTIPEGISAESAGPLLCAGNTVFVPLVSFGVPSTAKVGVVGIGGLGHIAIKMYKAWGCHVTAFTSEGKFEEAKAMGAHRVANSRDEKSISALAGEFDFILYTPNQEGPWNAYVNALTFRGRLNFVGIPPKVETMPFLLLGEKSISGSGQCNPVRMAQMLQFCAQHQISPQVEVFDAKDINKAIEKVHDGSIRFRGVINNF